MRGVPRRGPSRADAARQLAPAFAFYREVGAGAYVAEAQALLPAAS